MSIWRSSIGCLLALLLVFPAAGSVGAPVAASGAGAPQAPLDQDDSDPGLSSSRGAAQWLEAQGTTATARLGSRNRPLAARTACLDLGVREPAHGGPVPLYLAHCAFLC